MDRVQDIRGRLNGITAGPWMLTNSDSPKIVTLTGRVVALPPHGNTPSREDAIFISNAPADVAYLLEAVERLQGELDLRPAPAHFHLCVECDKPITPEPLDLFCPACGLRHVDEGEWVSRPHKTHRCVAYTSTDGHVTAGCGHEWRPYAHPTVGRPVCSHPDQAIAPESGRNEVSP